MIHIQQVIVVEGKYDKIKLASILDAVILVTDGYGIFKDKEKLEIIRYYAAKTGIIIATDSDSAGFRIRNFIKGAVREGEIINVYIPDIIGKEKRKLKPSKEGKLGVEGINREILLESFSKAGVIFSQKPSNERKITRLDFYQDGLMGAPNSSQRRATLLKRLDLPELLTTTSMLEIINSMLTMEDYQNLVAELFFEESEIK